MTKLKYRLIAAMVATSFACIVVLSCFSIISTLRKNEQDTKEYRAALYEQFDRSIKLEVETVHSLVQRIYNQQQKGLLSEADAKKQAADLVRDLRFDNGNYFWIDTTEGINVVLLGREVEGKSRINITDPSGKHMVKDIIAIGMQEGGGFTDFSFPKPNETESLPKRSYSLLFKPYNWVIGTGNWVDHIEKEVQVQAAEKKSQLSYDITVTLVLALIALGLVSAFAMYISRKISEPVVKVAEGVRQIAAGDLGIADLQVESKDEIGQLAHSVNEMKQHLKELIRGIANSSSQVAAASEQLTAGAEQSAHVVTQVAESINEVAQGAEKQMRAVSETSSAVEHISSGMQQAAAGSAQAAEHSTQAARKAKEGDLAVGRAVTQMASIEKTVNNSAQVVAKLGERSQEIGQIVSVISGIAGQTNLLALNAAIEAARAGEQGRGFAVVADEVRKLAEQSQEAAQRIAELIGEIQGDTDQAVVAMSEGTREVKVGSEVVTAAGQAFAEITELVAHVSEQVQDISQVMQRMSQGSEKIVTSVHTVSNLSEAAMGEAQTVSAATEEQSASMEEIASSSRSLANLAQDLQEAVSRFRL
nr:methyl-accepting chemotaxis protein [uncultured Anaeromusa sp.]